ncbi:hypothetical protein BJ322DRAFT_1208317 [Thelephora terrestris]|uniref:Uncharacterized protein n=1 Tax=Thelephora terrestris TaxID=56493 RepID=A0A9P6HP09_9AGAM|nr:hypothetical protein BJ322DRAFT_1208317 [Thelephora terrestris]
MNARRPVISFRWYRLDVGFEGGFKFWNLDSQTTQTGFVRLYPSTRTLTFVSLSTMSAVILLVLLC